MSFKQIARVRFFCSASREVNLKLHLQALLLLFGFLLGSQSLAAELDFGLGPEDVLYISVWKEPDLEKEVLVRPDGKISFPLVGHLLAANKSPEELEALIAKKLQPYLSDPVVHVAVTKVLSNKIYVIGKVAKPGQYLLGQSLDVMQALSLAGGLTPYANEEKVHILRRDGDGEVAISFNYEKVRAGRSLEQNIILQSGDVIVVQ